LDGLNGGGWGVFIAPTTIPVVVVDGHTRQFGDAPDMTLFTVRCMSRQPNCWSLEMLTVEVLCPLTAPDSPVAYQTVQCILTSQF
jgi:hypothetical protein